MIGHRYAVHVAVPSVPEPAQFAPTSTRPHSEVAADGETERRKHVTSRFRIAHIALLAQGLAIGVVGGFALAWSMAANLRFGLEGIPVLGLAVTPLHGGLLMAGGALAILACLGRWTTVAFIAIAAGGWATLTIVCAVEAAHHAPGLLGFDPRDTLLYGVLGAYNLALCIWLAPTLLADWRLARTGSPQH
ncbi:MULTISPECIES: hypothetical protein [unclassified Mycobacterium]|uniref:hypothetical protein n=1 Tax=unclassified Mycobacterium TaxID=2642494 RepID=UPI0029C8DA70|nr:MULTISPECIES: hypothetical protein [unclassified Mycobacterium]